MLFIAVEVEQETSAPPPKKKNPGSAPGVLIDSVYRQTFRRFVKCVSMILLHSELGNKFPPTSSKQHLFIFFNYR